MAKKKKTFLCVFDSRMGETEIKFHHTATGTSRQEVENEHEVEHENGLDTEDSPIGGANGQYCTELVDVIEITPTQKKFLNKIGIY
jgi:hypothetical protein